MEQILEVAGQRSAQYADAQAILGKQPAKLRLADGKRRFPEGTIEERVANWLFEQHRLDKQPLRRHHRRERLGHRRARPFAGEQGLQAPHSNRAQNHGQTDSPSDAPHRPCPASRISLRIERG